MKQQLNKLQNEIQVLKNKINKLTKILDEEIIENKRLVAENLIYKENILNLECERLNI